jgi:hypothetical protein
MNNSGNTWKAQLISLQQTVRIRTSEWYFGSRTLRHKWPYKAKLEITVILAQFLFFFFSYWNVTFYDLLNVFVQIANKMGLQNKKNVYNIYALPSMLPLLWSSTVTFFCSKKSTCNTRKQMEVMFSVKSVPRLYINDQWEKSISQRLELAISLSWVACKQLAVKIFHVSIHYLAMTSDNRIMEDAVSTEVVMSCV